MSVEEQMYLLEANGLVSPRAAAAALPTLLSGLTSAGCGLGQCWSIVAVDDEMKKEIDVDDPARPVEVGARRRTITIELVEAPLPGSYPIVIRRA